MVELRPGAFTRDPAFEGRRRLRPIQSLMSTVALAQRRRAGAAQTGDDVLVVALADMDAAEAMERIAATLRQERVIFTNGGEIKVRMHGGAWTAQAVLGQPLLTVGIQAHDRRDGEALAAEAKRVLRAAGLTG